MSWGFKRGRLRYSDAVGSGGGDPDYASVELHLPMTSNFNDVSTNNRTVTNNNGATISSAQTNFGFNTGLFASASSQYLSIADDAALRPGTSDFEIVVWARYTSFTSGGSIISKGNGGGGWSLGATGAGVFVLNFAGAGDILTLGTISTGQWYHIRVIRNNDKAIGFLDGVLVDVNEAAGVATNLNDTTEIRVGSYIGSAYLNGHIQDLRYTIGATRPSVPTGLLPTS